MAPREGTGPSRRSIMASPAFRPVLVRVGLYLLALGPILLAYATKQRALLVAPLVALVGAILLMGLLWDSQVPWARRLLYAAGLALVVGELTWALGYWAVAPVIGGAALWLTLYVATGVVEHGLRGTLDRSVAREFLVVAVVGIAIVVATTPWRA